METKCLIEHITLRFIKILNQFNTMLHLQLSAEQEALPEKNSSKS